MNINNIHLLQDFMMRLDQASCSLQKLGSTANPLPCEQQTVFRERLELLHERLQACFSLFGHVQSIPESYNPNRSEVRELVERLVKDLSVLLDAIEQGIETSWDLVAQLKC